MAASYPTSAKTWTPVADTTDTIMADHINDAYEEIIAVETDLLNSKSSLANNLVSKGASASSTESLSDLVAKVLDIPSWEYVSDWLDVRNAAADSIEILFADTGVHTAAFKVTTSAGQYHVDWGDTTSNDINSDALAEHVYTFGAGTACTLGYTTWKITITAAGGNITRFYVQPNSTQTQINYPGYLAACFNTPSLNSFVNAFYTTTGADVKCSLLEYFKMAATATSVTNSSYAFTNCYRLQYVDVSGFTQVTDASGMFNSCYALRGIDVSAMTKIQSGNAMFNACYSLQSLDLSAINSFTDIAQMCRSCYCLGSITFNASLNNVTTFQYGCYSCLALRSVNISMMVNTANLDYAFQNCYNLISANLAGLTDVTSMISCFNACGQLETCTMTNLGADAASTTATDAFSGCELLTSIAMASAKLETIGAYGASGKLNKTTAITFSASSAFGGAATQFKMTYNDMSAAQINTIFTALPSVAKTIDVTGCTGVATCDKTIATGKGWTVVPA